MTMMAEHHPITGGVDTHKHVHVAAALDARGGLLGVASFPTTVAGYRDLLGWLQAFGPVERVGIEGTGAWGIGLTRHVLDAGVAVVDVDRANRQKRRRQGKSDPTDAIAAARAALSGEAATIAKARDGDIEMIRVLRVVRRTAIVNRRQAIHQLRSIVDTAPDLLRDQLRDLTNRQVLEVALAYRPGHPVTVTAATKFALRELARRIEHLNTELEHLDAVLDPLVTAAAPELVAHHGVGTDTAGALLVAAGENTTRLHNEAAFARLCGVAPLEASSGRIVRHRLNRGGNRDANSALWRIVIVRMRSDPRTQAYVARRLAEGRTKREIIRCLKRYVARELFPDLPTNQPRTT
jgi:transposase